MDTTTASGRMFYAVLAALAAFESDLIGERTKLALDHKRGAGQRYCANAPYGSAFASDGSIVAVASERAVTRKLVALRRKGLSFRQIAAHAAESGIVNRSRKPFTFRKIAELIGRSEAGANERDTARRAVA